jgi:carboxyl-terminal processing protease
MLRRLSRVLVSLALAACSTKNTTSGPKNDVASAQVTTPTGAVALAAPATPAAAASGDADPREAILAKSILTMLQDDHLLGERIDDKVSRGAFKTYLDDLDSNKLFLLRADRDALTRYADQIDDEMRAGTLTLAHEGERVFKARVAVVAKMVAGILAAPMNHDDQEWVELDAKKLEPAATDKELQDRWRKRLELEVMQRVAQMEDRIAAHAKAKKLAAEDAKKKHGKPAPADAGAGSDASADALDDLPVAKIPTTPEGREQKARADLAKSYAARFVRLQAPGPLDPATDLINAVASTLDPHTDYLPPADKANFDIQMSGSLEGIGAALREHDDYIEVSELVPGGAAWRQGGLGPGDLILSVQSEGKDKDPVDVTDMRIDDVVKMIRGPKGTVVKLAVRKPDGRETTVSITRDVIVLEESYARGAVLTRKGSPAYGYIHLPSFYGGPGGKRKASGDIHRLLRQMAAACSRTRSRSPAR